MVEEAQHASEVLRTVAADPDPRLSSDEMVSRLDDRTFGIVFLILALINCMPLPPGVSAVTGVVMTLAALQLALGRHRLWLPRRSPPTHGLAQRLRAAVDRALPLLQRFERMCRPRYSWLTSGLSERLIGVIVLALGFVITLPIPVIGSIPPGDRRRHPGDQPAGTGWPRRSRGMAIGVVAFAINVGVVGAALFAAFAPAEQLILDFGHSAGLRPALHRAIVRRNCGEQA